MAKIQYGVKPDIFKNASSTEARCDLGQAENEGAKFYLGQVQLRPVLACPFDHPKCQVEKKEK